MFPQVPASSNVRKPAANMLKSSLLQFLLCNFALLLLLLPGSVNGVRGKHLCAICVEYHDGPAPKNMEQFCALHCRLQQQPQPPPQFANVLTSSACLPGAVGCPCSPGAHGCPNQLAPAAPAAPYVILGTDGRLISHPQPVNPQQHANLLSQANARLQKTEGLLWSKRWSFENTVVPNRYALPEYYAAEVAEYNTAVQNYNTALGEVQRLRAAAGQAPLDAQPQQKVAQDVAPPQQQQPTFTNNHHTYTQTGTYTHQTGSNVHEFIRIHTTAKTGPHAAHFPWLRR